MRTKNLKKDEIYVAELSMKALEKNIKPLKYIVVYLIFWKIVTKKPTAVLIITAFKNIFTGKGISGEN